MIKKSLIGTKLSPHDIRAEQNVLGSIILESKAIIQIKDTLKPDDFYYDKHKEIYTVMLEMLGRNESIDLITLISSIEDQGLKEKTGGELYLTELVQYTASPGHIKDYAKIVQKKSISRGMIITGANISNLGWEQDEEIENLIIKCKNQLNEFEKSINLEIDVLSGKEILDKYLESYIEKQDKIDKDECLFIPSGFPTLDKKLAFDRGQLITLGALTSFGKSAFLLNVAVNAARLGYKVLFVSIEMSENQLLDRVLSGLSGLDNTFFKKASVPGVHFDSAIEEYRSFQDNLTIVYDPRATTAKIETLTRKIKASAGVDIVIVDYIGIMADKVGKNETDAQRIDNITMGLKQLAGVCDCCIWIAAQFNRETRYSSVPALSQLKGSSGIEHASDAVLILYRQDRDTLDGFIRIAKNRAGSLGDIDVRFCPQTTTYTEYANPVATKQDFADL